MERSIVGVNKYTTDEKVDIPTLKIDLTPETGQIARIKALRQSRDSELANRRLQDVRAACEDEAINLMPPLIAIATFGLIVAEYTPVFEVLSYPLAALLSWLQITDAGAAAPALLVGFVEMFLPGVIAQGIESELTRFVIISVAITQLIYMSEVGVLILKTRIPLNFINLVTLFVLRTIIALPVIVAIAQGLVAAGVLV